MNVPFMLTDGGSDVVCDVEPAKNQSRDWFFVILNNNHMNTFKHGLLFSSLAVAYIAGITALMHGMERWVGGREDSVLAPIAFLMLFVVSAATMGMLVFGKPVMLYMDGKKREAVLMAVYTTGCLAVFTLIILGLLLVTSA